VECDESVVVHRKQMTRQRYLVFMALSSVLLLLVMLASLAAGSVRLPVSQVIAALAPGQASGSSNHAIVWDLRLSRIILAMLIGAGLATAGAAFQGLFRNPLADPYVVGASGGAALGATLAIAAGLRITGAGLGPVPLAAFIGALAAVAIVYTVAEIGGMASAITMLLAGAALSTVLSALVTLLMTINDRSLYEIFGWILGGLSGRGWPHLQAVWFYLIGGSLGLWLLSRPLDALACGEETAQTLGLPLWQARTAIVAAATITTAAAVAAGGTIGFIGLIAPHVARLIVGSNHVRLIPASAIIGALLLIVADDIARTVLAPVEIPVGVMTALLGGPFFLYLLKTRQRELGGWR
jgi:iron complex transport system permease protein